MHGKRGLLTLASLAIAVVFAEALCSLSPFARSAIFVVDPDVGVVRAPSQRGLVPSGEEDGRWTSLTINALGLRGDEVPMPKPAGETRVLCLGDSFVFGGGLGDDETLTASAQRLCGRGVDHARFINAGGNGHDTRTTALALKRLAPLVDPDVVVIGWNWNDVVSLKEPFRLGADLRLAPAWVRRTALYKTTHAERWPRVDAEGAARHRDEVLAVARTDAPYAAACAAFESIATVCRNQKCCLLVLAMPELTWTESGAFPSLPKLAAVLDRLRIAWVDGQPAHFAALRRGEKLTQALDPCHPSAAGTREMARVLLRALWERGWIPEAPTASADVEASIVDASASR